MEKLPEYSSKAKKSKVANQCILCNSPGTLACNMCHTNYCSEKCVFEDWPTHKKICYKLARESNPQNQKIPPLNQNQSPIMPELEKSRINPNLNHNFASRDPRLKKGSPGNPQNPQQGPISGPYVQTKRSFPPPRIDLENSSSVYNRLRELGQSNISGNVGMLDPRLSKIFHPPHELVQDIGRGTNTQSNISYQAQPNEKKLKYDDSNELFTRRPPKRSNPEKVQSEPCKIRVKSIDSLKESTPPKPPDEKVTTKLLNILDEKPFSSIFGAEDNQASTDVEDLDLDDTEMYTGPERMHVIGLVREENDKYWVIREVDHNLWETMQEDVKNCSRNRTMRPMINAVGACLYEGEWYRGKIIRVRPTIKVHFLDYGNTEEYKGVIKELPKELARLAPLAFLIQFTENTPRKYFTKDLDGCRFEVEIINKLKNGIRQVRIPQQDKKVKKEKDSYTLPNFSKKHPVILCGYNVNEVFIRPNDENSARNFEKLRNDIDEHVAKELPYTYPPQIGEMVCAINEVNKNYCRARVESLGENNRILVKFVDYVGEQETFLDYLKPLPEYLKEVPDCIVKLKLADVPYLPPPPEIIAHYNWLVSTEARLIMNYDDNSDGVILEEEVTGLVLNDHVFRTIFNKIKEKEMITETSLKFINLDTVNLKKLIISHIDKEEFYKSTMFYVNDPQHESYDFVNEKLASEISSYCEKETVGFVPELKELCLAQIDGVWHRGINLECIDENQFKIFFIDWGIESLIHSDFIRRMPREFSEAPCLAIRATIADSKKLIKNKKLNDDVFEYLESNINQSIANVEVVDVVEDGLTSLTTLRFPEIDRVLK